MKLFAWIFSLLIIVAFSDDKDRKLEYGGAEVLTTFQIDKKFIGRYSGSKSGFLVLGEDGTGTYRYDHKGLTQKCSGDEIEFKWGFILDENKEVVRFEREYGYSYPIIYNCSGENAFQGCTKRSMLDYLLVYKDGTITISSSDDWVKTQD